MMSSTEFAPIRGKLESIDGRIVEGWAFDPKVPDGEVVVEISVDERFIGSVSAGVFRQDLADARVGDGRHGFQFLLPSDVLDGGVHRIGVRVQGTGQHLGDSPKSLDRGALEPSSQPLPIDLPTGAVDTISEDGWVQGWAWYPTTPNRRVEVEILADGIVVGSAVATTHRADLAARGLGDGNYAFSVALPFEILTQARESVVLARDRATGHPLSPPRIYRRRALADALAKIASLEDDLRLLRASLDRMGNRDTADQRASADLFRTVGDFFVRLAEASAAGKPASSLVTLSGAVDRIGSQFAELEFQCPSHPDISFCVTAGGPVDTLYNTLRVLADIGPQVPTEVMLSDDGACREAALMPLVARNLRYLPSGDAANPGAALGADTGAAAPPSSAHQAIAARNRIAASARGEILVFLAAHTEPVGEWLAAIRAAFDADARTAMLAAKIQRADGVLDHAGVDLGGGEPSILGSGENPDVGSFTAARNVDGVASEAFAVRAAAWRQLGGLDERCDGMVLAMNDFCTRLRADGADIVYVPDFQIFLAE